MIKYLGLPLPNVVFVTLISNSWLIIELIFSGFKMLGDIFPAMNSLLSFIINSKVILFGRTPKNSPNIEIFSSCFMFVTLKRSEQLFTWAMWSN